MVISQPTRVVAGSCGAGACVRQRPLGPPGGQLLSGPVGASRGNAPPVPAALRGGDAGRVRSGVAPLMAAPRLGPQNGPGPAEEVTAPGPGVHRAFGVVPPFRAGSPLLGRGSVPGAGLQLPTRGPGHEATLPWGALLTESEGALVGLLVGGPGGSRKFCPPGNCAHNGRQ